MKNEFRSDYEKLKYRFENLRKEKRAIADERDIYLSDVKILKRKNERLEKELNEYKLMLSYALEKGD